LLFWYGKPERQFGFQPVAFASLQGACFDIAMDDWNSFRLVLAIHRTESLTSAAQELGIDHSTAYRRLNALEATLGVRLFERLNAGAYEATAAGQQMAATAERMDDEILTLDRNILGRDRRLSGRLRVTCSESIGYRLLPQELARFRSAHPNILVELVIANQIFNLAQREADIALRAAHPKDPALWGRKLADTAWTFFASPQYLQEIGGELATVSDAARCNLIGAEWGLRGIAQADWINAVATDRIVYRTNSLLHQMVAAKAGIGLALLPCYLGDPEAGLGRALLKPIDELQGELWIVTHADLKRTARVRAFFEIVGEAIARQPALSVDAL
jgi:DNA-binding transcriptional LysR family regulator